MSIELIITITLYFLPAIIAAGRKAKRSAGIFVLNLFLGWTFLGWVAAFVWAVADSKVEPQAILK